jgi:hypothetical protein
LHLPHGANRFRCPPDLFTDYIFEHARSWYKFANDKLRRGVRPGSLCLITTCDKTDLWMVGVFNQASAETSVSLSIGAAGVAAGHFGCSYGWGNSSCGAFRTAPHHSNTPPPRQTINSSGQSSNIPGSQNMANRCVFFKGYRITVREPTWRRSKEKVLLEGIHDSKGKNILTTQRSYRQSGHGQSSTSFWGNMFNSWRQPDEVEASDKPSFVSPTRGASSLDEGEEVNRNDSSGSEDSITLMFNPTPENVCG